jgi:hypothetical protein
MDHPGRADRRLLTCARASGGRARGPGGRAGAGRLGGVGYLADIVDGPTFLVSQSPSGRAARKKPAM